MKTCRPGKACERHTWKIRKNDVATHMKSQALSNVPGDGNRRKCLQVGVVRNSLKKQSTAQIVNIESPTNRPTRKNDTGHTNHLNLQATKTLAMKFTVPLGCMGSLYGVLKIGCCGRGTVALLDITRHKTVPSLSPHFPGSLLCCTPLNPIQGQKSDAVTMFKCMNSLAPSYLISMFVKRSSIHTYNTRHCNQLQIPKYRKSICQQSFLYRATKIWNSLSGEHREIKSLKVFKNSVKRMLLDNWLKV